MIRTFTCIGCPLGCDIEVRLDDDGQSILTITGQQCRKGLDYVEQEIKDPKRIIATSIAVIGGQAPITSVRLTAPIPKDKIFEVMAVLKSIKVQAPVSIGQVVVQNILGLGSDVIVTRNVLK